MVNTQSYHMFWSVQKNGTPLRKPRYSGGSPMGVMLPPQLLTMKMNSTMWMG